MNITDGLLSLLFPRLCLSCNRPGKYYCSRCIESLEKIQIQICPMCARPAIGGSTHPGCARPYGLDGLISVFRYTGAIRKGVKLLKYRRVRDVTSELVGLVVGELHNHSREFAAIMHFVESEQPTLIPLPLHWLRQRVRWYNQSELLAREFATAFHLEVRNDILLRSRYTPSQAGRLKKDRMQNIKDAFEIHQHSSIKLPSSIIIIDDVWTTGATMREAGKILKRAGVKTVWGMTIAR